MARIILIVLAVCSLLYGVMAVPSSVRGPPIFPNGTQIMPSNGTLPFANITNGTVTANGTVIHARRVLRHFPISLRVPGRE